MTLDTKASGLSSGDSVHHERYGTGRVEFDRGLTVIVRFEHGLEECEKTTLTLVSGISQQLVKDQWNSPLEVVVRSQAEAIQSINDQWGVFSRSRIALLPHQLWVCRRVFESWPTRWLVADDVGLGKTIEAGLVLWPLIAKGTVRRLLILCPASLTEQWQYRLRTMFDIRVAQYATEVDTEKSDFWNTHAQVVASLQTLRLDREGRQRRLLESDPWDLLIVDEAHHLNADEEAGPTLGYELVRQLVENNRVASILFFTGTPHRGKNYGFISLLTLLRPDLFDRRRPLGEQLHFLRQVMIRNNKQNVTDLKGNKLFDPPLVSSETYAYSEAEARFYDMLTEFIATGKAYASSLSSTDMRAVMLVLISMQKLASSSVAAIRRALKGRLARINQRRSQIDKLRNKREALAQELLSQYEGTEVPGEEDQTARLDEQLAELSAELVLMEDEEPRLRELIAVADEVREETKINRILALVQERFSSRAVLFFTEYKATQSLLMSSLIRKYGDASVTFINGDERADEVVNSSGATVSIAQNRENAADKFNAGSVRFLVSTEAAGEGIDLQENCHSLIHVDLPWNPMRLHQRVGRLNRYGQTRQVEVITLRNPATVESRIWDKLNNKIQNIMLALGHAMDEPEDLMQLVLGMTAPSLFLNLFAEASEVPPSKLSSWFDQETARFGGKDVIDTVKEMVGHCAKFDFQEVADQLPHLDLPDLKPFFLQMLRHNRRQVRDTNGGLSFKTPDVWWRQEPGVFPSYEQMVFDRLERSPDAAKRILGVGHKLIDSSLKQAKALTACLACFPQQQLPKPLILFRVIDQVTGDPRSVRRVLVGVEVPFEVDSDCRLLRDVDILLTMNGLCQGGLKVKAGYYPETDAQTPAVALDKAQRFLEERLGGLNFPFRIPVAEQLAVLWPARPGRQEEADAEEESQPEGETFG